MTSTHIRSTSGFWGDVQSTSIYLITDQCRQENAHVRIIQTVDDHDHVPSTGPDCIAVVPPTIETFSNSSYMRNI